MFLIDLIMGTKTNAPEIRTVNKSGPSICSLPTSIRSQVATHKRVNITDCVVDNGLLISILFIGSFSCLRWHQ